MGSLILLSWQPPVFPVQAVRCGLENSLKIQMKFGNFKSIRSTLRGVLPNNLAYCNAFHIKLIVEISH